MNADDNWLGGVTRRWRFISASSPSARDPPTQQCQSNVLVTVTPTFIELDHLFGTNQSQPLYITITCVT